MMLIALATAMVCTVQGNTVVCQEEDRDTQRQRTYVSTLARRCVSKVHPLQRDRYPGGAIQLLKDCHSQAEAEAKALLDKATRTIDQNGVQR